MAAPWKRVSNTAEMARSVSVLQWNESREVALLGSMDNVPPSIDGLLANAEHLNQVVCFCFFFCLLCEYAEQLCHTGTDLHGNVHAACLVASVVASLLLCT